MTSSNKLEVILEENYFDYFVESSLEYIEQYYEHNHSLNNDVMNDVLLDEYLELELNELLESNGIFYIFENMDELELDHFDTNYINKETKYNENCHHYNCVINDFLDNVIRVSKQEYVNILNEIDTNNGKKHDENNDVNDDNKSIISNITKKTEDSVLSDESLNEIFKSLCEYLEECMEDDEIMILMIEPDVYDLLFDLLEEYVNLHYDEFISINDVDKVYNIIDDTIEWYFTMINVPRSYDWTYILKKVNKEYVEERLKYLENVYQPEQKSEEWYNYRNNLITASDAYCAFGSEAVKNSLIYQKCNAYVDAKFKKQTDEVINNNYYVLNKAGVNGCLFEFSDDSGDETNVVVDDKECDKEIKTETKTVCYNGLAKEEKNVVMPVFVNTNSTLHWGNKYEPISVMIYEDMFNTKVGLFGCIKHEKYNFLGASPDGINVDKENERYGRMLEIKNIVNREINGVPKKEYWVQMQMQMETCELDECDFLETKFYQCENEKEYEELEDDERFDKNYKGLILWFSKETTEPYYVYVPLEYTKNGTKKSKEELEEWINKKKEEELKNNNRFVCVLYWKLEKLSCVLVPRNKKWFNAAVKKLSTLWNTIEKEREDGFEHRKPTKSKQRNMFIEDV